jgi:hypothetical protein
VGAQIALSLALRVAAGVFVRAGVNASSADPGFPLSGGLVAEIDVGIAGFDETRGRVAYAAVLDRVRALPGVEAASGASIVPFGTSSIDREVTRGSTTMRATFTVVGADYFSALGLPIVAGREFVESESVPRPRSPSRSSISRWLDASFLTRTHWASSCSSRGAMRGPARSYGSSGSFRRCATTFSSRHRRTSMFRSAGTTAAR